MFKVLKRVVTAVLCLALFEMPMASASAKMISTSTVISELTASENRAKAAEFLQREEVKKELVKYGVTSEEASKRLASLSDSEVRDMVGQMGTSQAGGDVIIISLTTILLIIIIYLLVR